MTAVALLVFIILVVPISLGVLAGIIALLINPRTRVATGIVLVVAAPAILLVVATGFVVFARYTAHDVEMGREQAAQQMKIRKSKERTDTPPSGDIPVNGAMREMERVFAEQMGIQRSIKRTNTPPSGNIPVEQGYYQDGEQDGTASNYREGADIQRPPGTFPTKGSSSMAWSLALPAFILIALVSLGVLAAIIALLINPRTRVATGIVLVVAVPVILLVAAGLYWGHSSHLISEGLSLLVFLVFLGVLAGIIALLINPRTRVAAGIVLVVVVPVILLVGARLFWGYSLGSLVAPISVSSGDGRLDRTNRADTPPSGNIPVIGAPPTAPPPEQGHAGVAGDGGTVTGAPPTAPPPEAAEKPAVKPPPTSLAAAGTAARPAWVDAPPQLVDDVYQMAITVGPYTTRLECDANLPEKIQEAVDQYVEVCLGPEEIDAVRLPAEYLRQQLVKDQWEEVRQHSIGPMTQLHVLLQFDRGVKDRVVEEHRQAVVAHRLWLTGAGLTAALGLLAVAFGYLKFTGFRVQGSEVRGQGSEEV